VRSRSNHSLPTRRGYDSIELVPVTPTRWLAWWETNGAGCQILLSNGIDEVHVAVETDAGHAFVDFPEPGGVTHACLLDARGAVLAQARPRTLAHTGEGHPRLRWRAALHPDEHDPALSPPTFRLDAESRPVLRIPARATTGSHDRPRTAPPRGTE
jgi:hypothetical protein